MSYMGETDKAHMIRNIAIFAAITLVIGMVIAIFVFDSKGGNR